MELVWIIYLIEVVTNIKVWGIARSRDGHISSSHTHICFWIPLLYHNNRRLYPID